MSLMAERAEEPGTPVAGWPDEYMLTAAHVLLCNADASDVLDEAHRQQWVDLRRQWTDAYHRPLQEGQ